MTLDRNLTDKQLWLLDRCIETGDYGEFDEVGRSDFFHIAEQEYEVVATEADYNRWVDDAYAYHRNLV